MMIQRLSGPLLFVLTAAITLLSVWSCGKDHYSEHRFCSVGSEKFNPLIEQWNTLYTQSYPGFKPLAHDGKGNGAASLALRNNLCELAPTTRPLSNLEIDRIMRKSGSPPLVLPIAIEGLNIIASKSLSIQRLSLQELKEIFHNAPDKINSHELQIFGINSATDRYRWFKTAVLNNDDFSDRVIELPGTTEIIETVSRSTRGISYAGPAETNDKVKIVRLSKIAGGEDFSLNLQTAQNGQYPILRYYYINLPSGKGDLSQETLKFLEIALSKEGQSILESYGLFPLSETDRKKALSFVTMSAKPDPDRVLQK